MNSGSTQDDVMILTFLQKFNVSFNRIDVNNNNSNQLSKQQ